MKTFLILLALASCYSLTAQRQLTQKMTVKSTYLSPDSVKPDLQYLFPEFIDGTVIFKNKETATGVFNYNMVLDEVLFIDEKGQKLALAHPEIIKYVVIGERIFLPARNGYYEIIATGHVNLLLQQKCKVVSQTASPGMGISTNQGTITNITSMDRGSRIYHLSDLQDVVLTVEPVYYLMKGNKMKLVLGLNTFLKTFPQHEKEIQQFASENKLNFENREDLIKLLKYSNSLKN